MTPYVNPYKPAVIGFIIFSFMCILFLLSLDKLKNDREQEKNKELKDSVIIHPQSKAPLVGVFFLINHLI
jgi:hypothetical protein